MEFLGIDELAMWQQVVIALLGISVTLYVIAPIGGRILFDIVGRFTPDHMPLVQIGIGFIIFVLSFAITLGVMLRWGPALKLGLPVSLAISLINATLATGITAAAVHVTLDRPNAKIEPEVKEAPVTFGVWDEDARKRRKNLRRR